MKRKARGSDLILGIELVHEAPRKTKANFKVFQLRGETGQRRRRGRGWRRRKGSKGGRSRRRSEGRDTLEKNGWKEWRRGSRRKE